MTVLFCVVAALVLIVLAALLIQRAAIDDARIRRADVTAHEIRRRLDITLFRSAVRADGLRVRRELRMELNQPKLAKGRK